MKQNEIEKRMKQLDKLRNEFESYDLQLSKDLNLESLTVDDLNKLLDITPASGTRFRIVRQLQKLGAA